MVEHKDAFQQARDEGFNAGTIAALAVITAMDCGVTWAEVVRAAGTQQILRHALTNEGDWEWAGFKKYAVKELGSAEVAKARRATRGAAPMDPQRARELAAASGVKEGA